MVIGGIKLHYIFKTLSDGYRVLPICVHHGDGDIKFMWDCVTGDKFRVYNNPLWPIMYRVYRAYFWVSVMFRFFWFILIGFKAWYDRSRKQ
jgi:hypothetical protein